MQTFTHHRTPTTPDQLWLLQHPPVFTQGTSCHATPTPASASSSDIPLIPTDRGGQLTYHAPGQLIAYPLLDLKRRQLGIKTLVRLLEQVVIDLLATYAISATRRPGAPGVYIHRAKIAALGLRISRGCCYHGLSLNVAMNLTPYTRIVPCGIPDLPITQLSAHTATPSLPQVETQLATLLLQHLNP